MRSIGITIGIFLELLLVENRMLPIYYETEAPVTDTRDTLTISDVADVDNSNEKAMPRSLDDEDSEEYMTKRKGNVENFEKQCAVVVLSNIQNPTMQSLLRKYRYDKNGILIPSSVKYYIKLPKGLKSASILVPLNDKAFSPLGGFVRYYKEVPPIPHACCDVPRNSVYFAGRLISYYGRTFCIYNYIVGNLPADD